MGLVGGSLGTDREKCRSPTFEPSTERGFLEASHRLALSGLACVGHVEVGGLVEDSHLG